VWHTESCDSEDAAFEGSSSVHDTHTRTLLGTWHTHTHPTRYMTHTHTLLGRCIIWRQRLGTWHTHTHPLHSVHWRM